MLNNFLLVSAYVFHLTVKDEFLAELAEGELHAYNHNQNLSNPSATREKDPRIPEVLEHRVESRPRRCLRRQVRGTREEVRRRDRGKP